MHLYNNNKTIKAPRKQLKWSARCRRYGLFSVTVCVQKKDLIRKQKVKTAPNDNLLNCVKCIKTLKNNNNFNIYMAY